MVIAALVLGFVLGAALVWLASRAGLADLSARADRLGDAETELARLQATLEHERASTAEKVELLQRAEERLANRFQALSAEALHKNNESFLQLAHTQLAPIKDSLLKVDRHAEELERARREAYGRLLNQVQSLAEGQEKLRSETGNLVTALRAPHVRGRWGEMQLKRVVELAGMVAHCDFVEQRSTTDEDGRTLRPDLVVRLPGGKNVVVDAKAPLAAYLDGLEATDEEIRRAKFADHARQVREHITKLGAKRYWQQFEPTPDFVVMFMPDETFFKAALEHDPSLIEAGVDAGVLPSSPTTLIALLRTVAYGWQQETVAESARAVSALGRELYERLGTMARHVAKLGRSLDTAVGAYNEAIGSLESRVLVSARKFEQHGVAGTPLPDLEPLERQARPLLALELSDEDEVAELPPRSGANAA
jgi:DNA recombination protein RmuC